ncbi:50S ribosomal protein L3 [Oscillospiraceae bacterium HV4-5-C5C]|nr:50S ribosomal protein L3 [Oscillospiraceae bacterium HV4-5-C5C]
MSKFMLGRKVGMTQLFDENGSAIPVTVIECGPVYVIQKKTADSDGYTAVRVAFTDKRPNTVNKPDAGQFKTAGVTPKAVIREFHTENADDFSLGQEIKVSDMLAVGDHIDVVGTSKGKGFAGNIKRHNQKGGKEAHGSKYHRRVGSLGTSATPSRVLPGKKLPGHMGSARVTVQNLDVVMVDGERNILAVRGACPGIKGAFLEITTSVKHAQA